MRKWEWKKKQKAVSSQWKTKTEGVRKNTKKKQSHYILCSQIYPWADMLHEHLSTYSAWQKHVRTHTKAKQNVKWAPGDAHLAFLFAVVFFCALRRGHFCCCFFNHNQCEIRDTMKKTTWILQKTHKKNKVTTTEWLTKTTTLVHSIVCVWVRIKNPDSKHKLLVGIGVPGEVSDGATQRWEDLGEWVGLWLSDRTALSTIHYSRYLSVTLSW